MSDRSNTQDRARTFFITGVSSGLGRAFAVGALEAGHQVVGTVRSAEAGAAFEAIEPGRAHAEILDITDFAAIPEIVSRAERLCGAIDVLVNNAGYGHEGILEETPLDDIRRQFEANVFGTVAVIQAVLPGMRRRRSGHIVNVTSMGGFVTMPSLAVYSASKFAMEGVSETLAQEVKPLGIKVTSLAPGQFRTDWAGRSMQRGERTIADYDAVMNPIRARRQEGQGSQSGDPAKAARALLQLVASDDPPTRLFLGADALKYVGMKLDAMRSEIAAWESVSRSTDFD